MAIDVILGLQWGDEGKGKIVDFLAPQYDIIARFQGGPNAGHTLNIEGKKYVLHTIPSGIYQQNLINIVGNGVVIDPVAFKDELEKIEDNLDLPLRDRLLLSKKAHLILPTHRYLDMSSEAMKGKLKIGSTLKGIGPTYMDKTGRNGLRLGDILLPQFMSKYQTLKNKHLDLLRLYPAIDFDLAAEEEQWFAALETLRSLQLIDSEYYINNALKAGKNILAEGAQGSMLDIDFGTYPFVTSSNTVTAGVCSGLGVPPSAIREVIGITKAYCTRVGSGPFPTELSDQTGDKLRQEGHEFGSTTGRPRRCGWIDLPQLRYAIMINGVTQLCMTKIDVLNNFETICAATHYKYDGGENLDIPYDMQEIEIDLVYRSFDGWQQSLNDIATFETLPAPAQKYIQTLETLLETPFTFISTGPEREKLIVRG